MRNILIHVGATMILGASSFASAHQGHGDTLIHALMHLLQMNPVLFLGATVLAMIILGGFLAQRRRALTRSRQGNR